MRRESLYAAGRGRFASGSHLAICSSKNIRGGTIRMYRTLRGVGQRVVAISVLAVMACTASWAGTEPAGSMAVARDAHVAVALVDGRVLVAGGYTPQGLSSSAEIHDPATGLFSAAAPLAVPRGGAAAARLLDGRVL